MGKRRRELYLRAVCGQITMMKKKLLVFVLSGKMDSPPKTSKQNDFSDLCIQRRDTFPPRETCFFLQKFPHYFLCLMTFGCLLLDSVFLFARLCNTHAVPPTGGFIKEKTKKRKEGRKQPCPSLLKLFCSSSCPRKKGRSKRRRRGCSEKLSRFNFNESARAREEGNGGGG